MGGLEIQLLADDTFAHRALGIDAAVPGLDAVARGGATVRIAADLASALPGVSRLVPLMISLDWLKRVRTAAELGEEYYSVDVQRTVPVRFPRAELMDAPQRFDVLDLACGDLQLAALLPHDAAWPHVMVHRAYPRATIEGSPLPPKLQRAFFAALRDAVRPLVTA